MPLAPHLRCESVAHCPSDIRHGGGLKTTGPVRASLPFPSLQERRTVWGRAQALGVDVAKRLEILRVDEPPKRRGGVRVASVAELVDKLQNEAKVI